MIYLVHDLQCISTTITMLFLLFTGETICYIFLQGKVSTGIFITLSHNYLLNQENSRLKFCYLTICDISVPSVSTLTAHCDMLRGTCIAQ